MRKNTTTRKLMRFIATLRIVTEMSNAVCVCLCGVQKCCACAALCPVPAPCHQGQKGPPRAGSGISRSIKGRFFGADFYAIEKHPQNGPFRRQLRFWFCHLGCTHRNNFSRKATRFGVRHHDAIIFLRYLLWLDWTSV